MMKGGLAGLMKQAQAMQENMKKAQSQLAEMEVEGVAGAGMVKVLMTCAHEVRRVNIDPSLTVPSNTRLIRRSSPSSRGPTPSRGEIRPIRT